MSSLWFLSPTTARRILPLSWGPLVLVFSCAAGYGLFFLLPYVVNDLGRFPLADVAIGYHDPKDLWPLNTGWGVFAGVGGLLTLSCGPFVVATAMVWGAMRAWRSRDRLDIAAVVLGAIVLVGVFSPFGLALMSWWLD